MSVGVGLCVAAICFIESCLADTPKSSKPTPAPQKLTMVNWAKLEVVDYLRSGALIIAFFAILLSDKRGRNVRGSTQNMWVNAEVVAFFVTGMGCYFFPTQFMEYYTKTSLSSTNSLWSQLVGSLLIGSAVTMARLQKNLETDPIVHYSWLVSRLLGSMSLFAFLQKTHCDLDIFTDQNQTFVLLGVFLWMAGCVWQLFTTDRMGGAATIRSIGSPMNWYLLVNIALIFTCNTLDMTNPDSTFTAWTNVKPDGFQKHQLQAACMLGLALALLDFAALFWANDEDKKQVCFGKLLTLALMLVPTLLNQYKNNFFTEFGFGVYLCGMAVMFAINLRAYLLETGKQKSR